MGPGEILWGVRLRKFRKFFAVVLSVTFTLAPISPAFAQESSGEQTVVDAGASSGTSSIGESDQSVSSAPDPSTQSREEILSQPSPGEPTDLGNAPTDQTPDSSFPDADNTESKPEPPATEASASVGAAGDPTSGDDRNAVAHEMQFEPDQISGSLIYSYPLNLPPGRNGLAPDLSLKYSSQPGSNANVVGYGWDFTIPFIERINRAGSDVMSGQTFFYSTMDGELASSFPGVYGPIAETGKFLKYRFSTSTNAWTVTDKRAAQRNWSSPHGQLLPRHR